MTSGMSPNPWVSFSLFLVHEAQTLLTLTCSCENYVGEVWGHTSHLALGRQKQEGRCFKAIFGCVVNLRLT